MIAACSGGVDSLALAQMLFDWKESWGLELVIAHFEHGIRGEASVEDARFVERWAEEHRLVFRMGRADVPLVARQRGSSVETTARELRYGFLEGLRREIGYDLIATAHHADDQAETVLMRLLRGSGIDGLAAMLPRSGHVVRPLLPVWKSELEDFCRSRGLLPRHDATNDSMDCTRNRLRLDLLPRLKREYNPGIAEALCHLATLAAEQREYMDGEAGRIYPAMVRGERELSQKAFSAEPPALQRALLRRFLRRAGLSGKDLGFGHFDRLRELLLHGVTGDGTELPRNWRAEISYGWMRLRSSVPQEKEPNLPEREIPVPGSTKIAESGICLEAHILREKPGSTDSGEYYCDYDSLPAKLRVRARRPGDEISLPSGRKSLKKLMIDSRIPREKRERIPVIVSGEHILWIPGLRRSNLFAVGAGTERILYLKITGLHDSASAGHGGVD